MLTSPRLRARRTAELAGFADAHVEDDLTEWDYGDYEGITTPRSARRVPDWTVWTPPVPRRRDAPSRSRARLDRVVAKVRAHGGRVLVFSHGHASRALAARWLGLPVEDGRRFLLGTATISVLGYERESAGRGALELLTGRPPRPLPSSRAARRVVPPMHLAGHR